MRVASYELQVEGLKARVSKVQVQIHELRVQVHELRVQTHELRVQIHELRVQTHELRVQIHKLQVQIHVRQFVRHFSFYDNLLFYVSTTPWLRLYQEAEWVNINFERIDLNSPQKSHFSRDDFGAICFFLFFYLKKTKCNRFFYSSILHKTLCCTFKLLLADTVSFSTSYQRWLIKQSLLISAFCLCLVNFLIFGPTKQPYSKVGNSRMYRYGNAVLTSNVY